MSSKKRILLIEDDGLLTRDFKEDLIKIGYIVVDTYSYADAKDQWKNNNGLFDCIILDLNINPSGMDEMEYNKYFPVHGILVLDLFCDGLKPEESIRIWEKTIIYSGYTDYFPTKKSDFPYNKLLHIIPKKGTSLSKVIEKVKQVVN